MDKKATDIKWYYQTDDYKIHPVDDFFKLQDVLNSEEQAKKYFNDKILLGCSIKGNFVEIIFKEKRLRVSVNKEEKFIDCKRYDDLIKNFYFEYEKLFKSKKTKAKKDFSITKFLNITGLVIVGISFVLLEFYSASHNANSADGRISDIIIIIFGTGCLLTFPRTYESYQESVDDSMSDLKGFFISIFGLAFVIIGVWKLFN